MLLLGSIFPWGDAAASATLLPCRPPLPTCRTIETRCARWSRSGLVEQRYKIEALNARVAKLLRAAFGQSSEKLRSEIKQLELVLADQEEQAAETDPASGPQTAPKDRNEPVCTPVPKTLARAVVEHAPPRGVDGDCLACGGGL